MSLESIIAEAAARKSVPTTRSTAEMRELQADSRTIPEILRANAANWPEREALIATRFGRDRKITFAELSSAAEAFALLLFERGVRPGDPVLVLVPMSIGLYIALLGILRLGAVAVFPDLSAGWRKIALCTRRVPPAALVAIRGIGFLRRIIPGLGRIPLYFAPPEGACSPAGASIPPDPSPDDLAQRRGGAEAAFAATLPGDPAPDDPALITFTSGSTGAPKAAVRAHRFLIAQHEALRRAIDLEPGERDLTTLPIFVLANLASGVTSIIPDANISRPGAVNAGRIARQIVRLNPTRTGGSPAFFECLADGPPVLDRFRKIYTGGAPVFPATLRELRRLAPNASVVAVYGSTEAEPIAHASDEEISAADWEAMRTGRGLLAGRPVPEICLRVVPDQWGGPIEEAAALPAGTVGEIIVTGAHVLAGYLNGEGDSETKVRIEDAIWHRTGDAGCLDEGGRLWLHGRCAARIRDERGTLYPFTVECVARSFSFVRGAAFVLHEGERLLILETDPAADLAAVRTALAWAGLAEIRVIDRLPMDARHNAKIDYPALAALLRRR